MIPKASVSQIRLFLLTARIFADQKEYAIKLAYRKPEKNNSE
jgi:hypothetical protein